MMCNRKGRRAVNEAGKIEFQHLFKPPGCKDMHRCGSLQQVHGGKQSEYPKDVIAVQMRQENIIYGTE